MRHATAVFTAITVAFMVSLTHVPFAQAQVAISGFLGGYDHGADNGHPFFSLAVGGRMGVHVIGSLNAELEAMHIPVKSTEVKDLFAYRLISRWDFGSDGIHPFLLAGLGWQQWRTWVCEDGSCNDPPLPGRRFVYQRGVGLTLGGGLKAQLKKIERVWFRTDFRFERSMFEAPYNNSPMLTLGMVVVL